MASAISIEDMDFAINVCIVLHTPCKNKNCYAVLAITHEFPQHCGQSTSHREKYVEYWYSVTFLKSYKLSIKEQSPRKLQYIVEKINCF